MAGRRHHWPHLTFAIVLAAAASSPHSLDVPYDGRFTFVRLRWGGGTTLSRSWSSAWNHDYPRAEQHLSQILQELTYLDIHTEGSRILSLDDPALFKYPIASIRSSPSRTSTRSCIRCRTSRRTTTASSKTTTRRSG